MVDSLLQPAMAVALSEFRAATGVVHSATPSGAAMALLITNPGTTGGTTKLTTANANAGTVLATTMLDFIMPYVAHEGDVMVMNISAKKVIVSGTTCVGSITASVREVNNIGTLSAELVSNPGTQLLGTADTDFAFTIDCSNISIGDRMQAFISMPIIESATQNASGVISSVRFGR